MPFYNGLNTYRDTFSPRMNPRGVQNLFGQGQQPFKFQEEAPMPGSMPPPEMTGPGMAPPMGGQPMQRGMAPQGSAPMQRVPSLFGQRPGVGQRRIPGMY